VRNGVQRTLNSNYEVNMNTNPHNRVGKISQFRNTYGQKHLESVETQKEEDKRLEWEKEKAQLEKKPPPIDTSVYVPNNVIANLSVIAALPNH
jgi:hypothetical protein